MTPESITIVLPLPDKVLQPNFTIGSFGGRMMVNAARKKYHELVIRAIENENVEDMPWGKVFVKAVFYYATNRRHDPDNETGSLKAAYDGIVKSGLVIDDDRKHMTRSDPEDYIDKKHPRVELTIERLE